MQIFSLQEPEIPSLVNRTNSEIVMKFTELTDGLQEYFYKLEADLHSSKCNIQSHLCYLDGLIPARSYEISLRACFSPVANRDVCSPTKGTLLVWTLPEGMLQEMGWHFLCNAKRCPYLYSIHH